MVIVGTAPVCRLLSVTFTPMTCRPTAEGWGGVPDVSIMQGRAEKASQPCTFPSTSLQCDGG
jgi:hypothetical protein